MARSRAHSSLSSTLFLLAMVSTFAAMVSGPAFPATESDESDVGNVLAKIFVISSLLGFTFLWELSVVYPYRRQVSLLPPNGMAIAMIAAVVAVVVIGAFAEVDYVHADSPVLTEPMMLLMIPVVTSMMCLTTAFIMMSRHKVDDKGRQSGVIFLIGIWTIAAGGVAWSLYMTQTAGLTEDTMFALLSLCVGTSGLVFAYAIAMGRMTMSTPMAEKLKSSTKSNYRLFLRYIYLVKEQKPDFSFRVFADILRSRCWDCQNDDSFPCESIDCGQCKLPCPCRDCKKYMSRPQGLVVTRQFPNDIRSKHYLQTTPIVWLSTVAGKDNMDPAKLNLLTDLLINFMEKSHNGVVLVDGIEYLITTNDFARVIRAIDRWTESAMTSSSRLIITIDPRSFDQKELALLERNKEVVRPDAPEKWMIIPEPI